MKIKVLASVTIAALLAIAANGQATGSAGTAGTAGTSGTVGGTATGNSGTIPPGGEFWRNQQ